MDSIQEVVDSEEEQSKEHPPILVKENENSILVEEEKDFMSEIFATPAESEILLEILSHLPPKIVFKFKCVSKSLSNLTRHVMFTSKHSLCCRETTCPFTGFFYQSKLIPHSWLHWSAYINDVGINKPEFVSIQAEAGYLPDPSLGFLKQEGDDDVVELIDSCNGLLLCSNTTWTDLIKTCFVCNPLTKEHVVLPHPRRRSNRVYYALLADLTRTGYLQYKVVCVYRPKHGDPHSKLLILSSETGDWEEFSERLPALSHESMMGSKVIFNGSLFWDCLEGHILVCHLNVKKSQRCYELIEAPRAPLGRCLWNFKDKLLCYCHGFPNELPVWSLCIKDKNKLKWRIEGCEEFEILTEDISRQYTENWLTSKKVKPRIRFKIIAYRPESKTMFLWIPDSIFSYELTERRLETVWGYRVLNFNSPSCALPYVHSLASIQIGKILEEEQGSDKAEVEMSSNGSNANDDFMEVMSFYENWANNVKGRSKIFASQS